MKAILDTSVLLAADVPHLPGELAISAATLAELHFGVLVTGDSSVRAERLRRLTALQEGSPRCRSTTPLRPATGGSLPPWWHAVGSPLRG